MQVYEPIRTMIMGAPLEDARFLTYRYERIRQDAEAQVILSLHVYCIGVKNICLMG